MRRAGVAARLLEQGVALAQDAVEVAAQRVVAGVEADQQVVEVAPGAAGPPLTRPRSSGANTVTWRAPEQVPGPAQGLAVDLDPVPAGRVDLGLDQQPPAVAVGLGPDDGLRGPGADQGLGGDPRKDFKVAR